MSLRALIVDDSHHFLAAARDLLEREGVVVVGVASTGREAVRLAEGLQPDVVLVDVELGGESGFDVAQRLTDAGEEPSRVVLISTYPEEDFGDLIAASRAVGFVAKSDLSASSIAEVLG